MTDGRQRLGDLRGCHEQPDVDVARLAQHLREQTKSLPPVPSPQAHLEIVNRQILVPEEIGAKRPLRKVDGQRAHDRKSMPRSAA